MGENKIRLSGGSQILLDACKRCEILIQTVNGIFKAQGSIQQSLFGF